MTGLILTTNDTAPTLTMTCSAGGAGASLAGATVEVHVLRPDGTVINRAGVVVGAADGTVSMAWQAGDLTVQGAYEVEAQVTYSDASVQTFGRSAFLVRREIA